MKRCSKCKKEKKLSEFYKRIYTSGKSGRSYICKICKGERLRVVKYGKGGDDCKEIYGNNCGICNIVLPTRFCIDHDHKTGRIRGVLCTKCNTGLGILGDSVESLERAIKYLESVS